MDCTDASSAAAAGACRTPGDVEVAGAASALAVGAASTLAAVGASCSDGIA